MAEMPEFEAAIAGLVDKLRQIGVPEDRVADTAASIAADQTSGGVKYMPGGALEVLIGSTTPRMQPMDDTGVVAGQYGLPPMEAAPSENPLAGPARMGRKIQERAMRGMEPTPEQAAYLQSVAPMKEARGEALGTIGRELTGIPQVGRAAEGISEAIQDPSISNLTNAGVQTGLAAFRPLAAAKALGLGYAAAGAKDAGLLDMGANAQTRRGQQPALAFTPLEGLTEAQNEELKKLRETDRAYQWLNTRDKDQGQARIRQLEGLSNKYIDTQNTLRAQTANQAEADKVSAYNRAVQTAEAAKAAELARDKRFSDTEVGKMYERFGILTPAMMAFGAGALSKAAGSPNYTVPMAVGAGTGAIGANWPLMYNAYFTEPDNPQRLAYEAYVRELPDNHPDKQKWTQYLETLPKANPLREVASGELYDPIKLAERSGIGALEGLLGGLAGAEAVKLPGRALEFAGSVPGRVRAGYRAGQAKADAIQRGTPTPAPAQPVPDPVSQEALRRYREAVEREKNLLAGLEVGNPPAPGVRPETGVPAPAPNRLDPTQQGAMPLPGKPSLAERVQTQRQMPMPEAQPNPAAAAETTVSGAQQSILDKIGTNSNGVHYWKENFGRIKAGTPVTLEQREFFGLKFEKPATSQTRAQAKPEKKASQGKPEKVDDGPIPEKPSVQMDDMAPMGSRRAKRDE